MIKAHLRNGLYFMEGGIMSANTSVAATVSGTVLATSDMTQLWHERLAHISEKGLKELSKQDLLGGDKVTKLSFCEECVLGKAHKSSYETGKHTSKAPLDYVHSDLWEPSRTETLNGGRYYMTVIDDYSRKVWLMVLKSKDEAFSKFRDWLIETDNQSGRK